jgi:hypothetical protein
MRIFNFTGRLINFYALDDTYSNNDQLFLQKFVAPYLTLPSSGETPHVYSTFEQIEYAGNVIQAQRFTDADRLEDFGEKFAPDDIIIAPSVWIQAARNLDLVPREIKLATVYGLIRNNITNKPIGVLGIEFK